MTADPGALAGRVEIWRVRHDEVPAELLRQYLEWLTPEERERRLRYRRPQDQLRYLVGRGLLRSLLQHYTGEPASSWQFTLGPYGRPESADHAPRFNLSHSLGTSVAAFASSGVPLGADVEARSRADHWPIAERFFADREALEVRRAEDAAEKGELFLRFWTLKEAYVKAVGQGISIGLGTFAFSLDPQRPPELRLADGRSSSGWHFFELPWPTERAAVAVHSPRRPRLIVRDFGAQSR